MNTNFSIKFLTMIVLSLVLGLGQTFAQSTTTGGINGTITDPQGGVVPNATVTVTNLGTNSVVTVTTNDNGGFRVTNLQPGTYRVETSVTGFAPSRADNIIVEVGTSTPVDLPLTLGTATAEVVVTAEAPVINTNDNANATNINQTSINELPINGRRWSNFALLTPSTVPDGTFGLISFRGISGLLNNNTVDGGDNNQAFFSEERGRTRINYVISQSAIREFQVNTSNYSAEYGRSAGGVVNAVTKSGTNEFHGDLFYYNRNNRNGARNPRATQTILVNGVPTLVAAKPVDLREQFGGTIGGPVIKDKLFFFFSYDQQKRNFPGVALPQSENFFNPINVVLPANCTPSSSNPLNPGQLLACRGVSQAQTTSTMEFLRSLTGEVPRKGDQTLFLPKIDWVINNSNTFSISYNRLRWDSPNGVQTQPTNTRGRASFGDDLVSVDSVNAKLQSILSSNILNEARVQWGRDFERQFSTPPAPGEPSTALGGTRAPSIFITNGFNFGTPNFLDRNSYPDERRWQFADTVTWNSGRHTFKFGGDINRVSDTIENLFTGAGSYSYNNIGDFIIDYVGTAGLPGTTRCINSSRTIGKCYTSNYLQGVGFSGIKLTTYDYNFFVQDDFRISPRLTVNLGLRYEFIKMPEVQLPGVSTAIIPNDGRTVIEATSTLPEDNNNFGPRIGVAYDVFGNAKTSFRAGYGIYYGRIQSSTIYNAMINTGNPGGQTLVSLAGSAATAPIFPNVLTDVQAAATGGAIQFFAEDFQAPMIHQYDAILEHEIMKNTMVSVSYIGSLGRNLPTFFDLNYRRTGQTNFEANGGPFDGQTFSLPLYGRVVGTQPMTRIQSTVKSEYNALVFQANRRFTDGLQFQASYTLAKSTDTNQNSATFTQTNSPYDIFDGSYDAGYSNFDRRHKFVASAVWAPTFYKGSTRSWGNYLLNGWSLSPIFTYYSGAPYDGGVSGSSLNGTNGDNRFPLLERNAFRLPSLINIDARLSKRFRLTESMNLELLAEAFNVQNRTHVFSHNSTLYNRGTVPTGSPAGTPVPLNFNSSFGQVTGTDSTLYRERQIQFAARFQF